MQRIAPKSEARAHASGRPPRTRPSPIVADRLGNSGVIRVLGARAAHARSRSDGSGAIYEQEADAIARRVTHARDVRVAVEEQTGQRLNDLRIHTDPAANREADALDARAFTSRSDIYFGKGEYQPWSSSGRELLAHEMAHVAQQKRGGAPDLQAQRRPGPLLDAGHGPLLDTSAGPLPDAGSIPPGLLTNQALVREIDSEMTWLAARFASGPDNNLHERRLHALLNEREARMHAGHLWLDAGAATGPLYTIVPQGAPDAGAVYEVSGARQSTGETNGLTVISQRQLNRALSAFNVPTVAPAIAGTLATTASMPPEYASFRPEFAMPYTADAVTPATATTPARTQPGTIRTLFTGRAGEHFYDERTPVAPGSPGRIDLNTVPYQQARQGDKFQTRTGSSPVYDFLEPTSELPSVKASSQPIQAGRFSYYSSGWSDLINAQPSSAPSSPGARDAVYSTFDQAVYNRDTSLHWPPFDPAMTPAQRQAWDAARAQGLRRGRLAVNAEDVIAYRANRANELLTSNAANNALIDAHLAQQGVTDGTATYTSRAQIEAVPNLTVRQALLTQIVERIAATMVISNTVRSPGLTGLQRLRSLFGLDPSGSPQTPRPAIVAANAAFPEMMPVAAEGYAPVMLRAAPRGAKMGGPAAMMTDTAVTLWRTGHLPSMEQAATSGVLGAGGGALGSSLETAANARIGMMLSSAPTAAMTRGTVALGRGLGGGIAGGIVAPLVTIGGMGWRHWRDPTYNPTSLDYGAAGGRALLIGGASSFLTAGLTALVFTGPVGWAAILFGLMVGVVIYAALDWLAGNAIERTIRYPFEERPRAP